ncbi:uncharacterized protein LOC116983530 [Amblyraja radiata]|uniref:uncharacterized protein LOC116983530 n=1 Tax=Amblyraja radiata TaxID=386614 RepID=UPI001402F3DD|nr:uncharacterized protein LOC116983530 [Amblyraja radiata]
MAEGGDWGGDAVTSTSSQQKGGKLGKVFKRLLPGTSSKKDGQNTGTTTEKQSGIESRTSMECEAAEEKREKCQSRGRGTGDVDHGPGTDPSGEIHHDRDPSGKESSSLIQETAERQNMVTPIHTTAEVGNRTAAPVTSTTRTDTDLTPTFSEFLTQWNDDQLFQLTKFYRERLKQAIEEGVESLGFMMRWQGYFSEQEHGGVAELVVKGNRRDSSTLFLSLLMGKGNRARRVMWESFVKMQNELPKLDKILKEIQELGPDPQEYMNIIRGLSELPSHMEDVQQKHKETLRQLYPE